jgi:hypothetical protein
MNPNRTSKDFELLKQLANSLGIVPEPVPSRIPDATLALCERFIEGDLAPSELEAFYRFASRTPWIITLLADFETYNPGWQEAQELFEEEHATKLHERMLGTLPRVKESFDFSILFELDNQALEIAWHETSDASTSISPRVLEMAHGSSNGERTSITHTRSTKHFNLTITVAYATATSFHMTIGIRAVDGSTDTRRCLVRISRLDAGSGNESQEAMPDRNATVQFDDLSEGGYKIEFISDGITLEHFTMNFMEKQ